MANRTPQFINECVQGLKDYDIPNLAGLYQDVAAGKTFTSDELKAKGYNYWNARNIAAWLNNEHKGMYEHCLGWE